MGLSSQLIRLPIWDAAAEGLKGDCEAEPSLWLAKLSPGWHSLPRAVGVGSVLAGTRHWSRAGNVLAGHCCPAATSWSLKSPKAEEPEP